jgi:hypothetical protein
MPAPGVRIDPSVRLLLELLRDPSAALGASAREWDGVVRVARATRLLAPLGARLAAHGVLERIPPRVRAHFDSEQALVAHRTQMARRLLGELGRLLGGRGFPVVVLKGGAYLLQDFACARGRLFSDVDLLVPRAHLDEVEGLLRDAGWVFAESLDAYDERYYREWSHELPPLEHPGHPLQLDLHHSILPPVGRVRPDDAALFAASVVVEGTPFRVLAPADQVLHVCAHVFQDSDLAEMLRDVADLDGLLREHAARAGFADELAARARVHGLGRALWYGLEFCGALFATPMPREAKEALAYAAPGPAVRAAMAHLGTRALLPESPDRLPSIAKRGARQLLFLRYLLLRFPLRLLVLHAAYKGARRFRRAPKDPAAGPADAG